MRRCITESIYGASKTLQSCLKLKDSLCIRSICCVPWPIISCWGSGYLIQWFATRNTAPTGRVIDQLLCDWRFFEAMEISCSKRILRVKVAKTRAFKSVVNITTFSGCPLNQIHWSATIMGRWDGSNRHHLTVPVLVGKSSWILLVVETLFWKIILNQPSDLVAASTWPIVNQPTIPKYWEHIEF